MDTIFWHDYETFGADTRRDRPCQFAGIRTDMELNVIGDPIMFYCKPSDDFLPSPEACLITGITPQTAYQEGYTEAEFAKMINDEFSVSNTCVAGYNSIRFDDEISRNLFYRNFLDPYEREWKNGNSRWDIIDLVRITYVLRPDGINWPIGEDGNPSFRLELLTEANNIMHEAAHDAMSDVYATIAIAKLIKTKQPQLYDFVFKHRLKTNLVPYFEGTDFKALFHVSSKYPVSLGCSAVVMPLFKHPHNSNGYVVFDLRQSPLLVNELTADEIKARLYTKKEELEFSGKIRPALKTIHLNKCPAISPASVIKSIPVNKLKQWEIDIVQIKNNIDWIRENPNFLKKIYQAFQDKPEYSDESDPELMLYSGFFSVKDKAEIKKVSLSTKLDLIENEFSFDDARLDELFFRYKARNFPSILSDEEHERWEKFRSSKIIEGLSGSLTFYEFSKRLHELAQKNISNEQQFILEELKYYAESIIPYLHE